MRYIHLLPSLALACSLGAHAQSAEPPSSAGSSEAVQAAGPTLSQSDRGHLDADARRCLELPTNLQVHRCAERYRIRIAHAKIETPKAAEKTEAKPAEAAGAPSDGKRVK